MGLPIARNLKLKQLALIYCYSYQIVISLYVRYSLPFAVNQSTFVHMPSLHFKQSIQLSLYA